VTVTGLDAARRVSGVEVFWGLADSVAHSTNEMLAAGGRVVTISAWSDSLDDAVSKAYEAAEHISLTGRQVRDDIGASALAAARG
jgi:phosphoribosylamine-glycine ligase